MKLTDDQVRKIELDAENSLDTGDLVENTYALLADREALLAENATLRRVVKGAKFAMMESARTFRSYEAMYRDKGTELDRVRAAAYAAAAHQLEAVLEAANVLDATDDKG